MEIPSSRPLEKVRLVTGTGEAIDPPILGEAIGIELGFYAEEGVELEITSADGSGGSTAALARREGEVANTNAPWFLIPAESGAELPVVTIYNWTRDVQWRFATLADGPVLSFADLKGKRIGVSGPGDSALPGGRAVLREYGLDADADIEWVNAGVGEAAAKKLLSGEIDVYGTKDYYFALLENLGLKLRYLALPPLVRELMGTGISTHRDFLTEKRRALVGFLRGLAKGTVFALENMEAAVRIHWKLFPDTKPDKPEDEALRETLGIAWARADKWSLDPIKLPRWGQAYPPGWDAYAGVLRLDRARLGDIRRFYTDELIDEVNQYDYDRIRRMARGYKG